MKNGSFVGRCQCGAVLFVEEKVMVVREKPIRFNLFRSVEEVNAWLMLPKSGEAVRLISPAGGWSSCSLILAIARRCKIKSITASTLRVGKKELMAIAGLQCPVHFILSGLSKENASSGKDYQYHVFFEALCSQSGMSYTYARNHSKVILLDTDCGKIIIETSSNLNENPKIEQFILTADPAVYDFYMQTFSSLGLL